MVANFIGSANFFEGRVSGLDDAYLAIHSKEYDCTFYTEKTTETPLSKEVCIAVRPEKITLSKHRYKACANVLQGVVNDFCYLGKLSIYRIKLANGKVIESAYPIRRAPSKISTLSNGVIGFT